jgi:hypothetical protein
MWQQYRFKEIEILKFIQPCRKSLRLELRLDRPLPALNPPAHECGSLKTFIPIRPSKRLTAGISRPSDS